MIQNFTQEFDAIDEIWYKKNNFKMDKVGSCKTKISCKGQVIIAKQKKTSVEKG